MTALAVARRHRGRGAIALGSNRFYVPDLPARHRRRLLERRLLERRLLERRLLELGMRATEFERPGVL